MTDLIVAVCWDELKRFLNEEEFRSYYAHMEGFTQELDRMLQTEEPDDSVFLPFFESAKRFGFDMAVRGASIEVLLQMCGELRKHLVHELYLMYVPNHKDRDMFVRIVDMSTKITEYTNQLIGGYNEWRSQEMARLYELQRNAVLDSLPFTVVVYDRDERCMYANRKSYEMSQNGPETVLGKTRQELVERYNLSEEPDNAWERLKTGERLRVRTESVDEDGLTTIDKELIPIFGEEGEFNGVISLCYPSISEKDRLYHMQRQFSFVLNSMNSGLLVLNQEFVIAAFNKKAEEIFGLEAERVLGTSLLEMARDKFEEGSSDLSALSDLMEQGRPIREVERTIKVGGRNLTLRISGNPIKNASGLPVGYILILDDLTELLAMREAVFRNEKFALIGQFAAGIAHEIRNPLTTVFGFLQLYAAGSVKHENFLDLTNRLLIPELSRANSILSDFLMVSKPTAPQRSQVDTGTFFADVVRLVESEANLRGAVLQVELPEQADKMPPLLLDVAQMKQVFLNLCKNAFDVTPPGGTLILRAQVEAEAVLFSVIDEGPGIIASDLSRIFDPFYTTKEYGTGLGLPISHRIVDGHGGTLQVRSVEGAGTTFSISIPIG